MSGISLSSSFDQSGVRLFTTRRIEPDEMKAIRAGYDEMFELVCPNYSCIHT